MMTINRNCILPYSMYVFDEKEIFVKIQKKKIQIKNINIKQDNVIVVVLLAYIY